jgi:glycosyltransferase involved in cell wall biosynthesis
LATNPSAAHEGRVPHDIDEWRQPFRSLIAAGATITAFDPSSVDVLERAFDLRGCNVNIAPHDDDYFVVRDPPEIGAQLHIGVLGTLTAAKGAEVVNDLASYIQESGDNARLTVIGASKEGVRPGVTVLGPYDVSQLVDIVRREQISVFLLASIIPETFSYSLSEIIKMGMPAVAFDVGAQGRRVACYEKGRLVPLESPPTVILDALRQAWRAARGETVDATDAHGGAGPIGAGFAG